MRKLLRYIKVIFLAGPVVLFYHFFYILKFARHPEKYPIEKRYKVIRKEVTLVLKKFKVSYTIKDLDKFINHEGKALLISNHLSLIDPMILIVNSEKPITFVAKKEAFKMPFVGKVCKALDVFALDRNDIMKQISQIRSIVDYLKDENKPSVVIYIEGTRNRKPAEPCLEFHPGTLKIAQMAGVPLFVGASYGTFRVLNSKSFLPKFPTFFSIIDNYSVEEFKQNNTVDLSIILKNKVDAEVDSLRKLDLDIVNSSKISKRRKSKERVYDVRVNS